MAQVPCIKRARGRSIDYTPNADVAAGAVVVLGTRLVTIAPLAIASGDLGALDLDGLWEVPKVSGSFTVGSALYWDADGSPASGDALSGAFTTNSALGPFAGFCALASAGNTVMLSLESLDAGTTTLRSALGQDDLAVYGLQLGDWKTTATGQPLGAAAGTPAGAFGLTYGTHGSAGPMIVGEAASGNSKTDKMRLTFTLPVEYVAGQTVTLRVRCKEAVGAATVSTSIDAEVYELDNDGGIGSDLCGTNAIDVTTVVGDKDFTIDPAGLAPGDTLDIELTGVTNDTGGSVGTVLTIYAVSLLLDVKG